MICFVAGMLIKAKANGNPLTVIAQKPLVFSIFKVKWQGDCVWDITFLLYPSGEFLKLFVYLLLLWVLPNLRSKHMCFLVSIDLAKTGQFFNTAILHQLPDFLHILPLAQ